VLKIYDITMLSHENPRNFLTIDQEVVTIIQNDSLKLGMYKGSTTGVMDDATKKALEPWVSLDNFENRMHETDRM